MLIRLLKYDVKKIIKFLTVFFVLALFFGVLTRIFGAIDDSLAVTIIKGICNGTTISMMFSLLINCFMRSWVLFRASLFGDESYLTHTLPIDRKTHYTAKACTAAISILFCMVSSSIRTISCFSGFDFDRIFHHLLDESVSGSGYDPP